MTETAEQLKGLIAKFEAKGWLRLGQRVYWREAETGERGGMPPHEVALRLSAWIDAPAEQIEAVLLNMRDDAAAQYWAALNATPAQPESEVVA